MINEEDKDEHSNPEDTKVKVKSKKENQQAQLEQIVKELRDVDSNILLSEMNKIIAELKQV